MVRYFIACVTCFFFSSLKAQVVIPAFPHLSKLPHVRDCALSANEEEVYFTMQSPGEEIAILVCMKRKNGKWTEPEMLPFSGLYRDIEPFLTNDGLRLYFSSNRPMNIQDTANQDYDIWYVARASVSDAWSEPIRLPSPVNSDADEFYPSLAKNNNLYFTSSGRNALGQDDLFMCVWNGKGYEDAKNLGEQINSEGYEFNAFISPDEQYILFTAYNRKEGLGSGDLFISRKNAKGQWQKAESLGSTINSKHMDYCPFYHFPSKTLYFTSKRTKVAPRRFINMRTFRQEAEQYENGLSRLYKCQLEL